MDLADRLQFSREGRLLIIAVLGAAVVAFLWLGVTAAAPIVVIAGLLIYVFRDPEREIPALPLAVVSPIDGRVVAVGQGQDPYLGRQVQRAVIQMHLTGVYAMRSPVEAKVMQGWFGSGEPAPGPAQADEPEPALHTSGRKVLPRDRIALWLQTDEGDDLVITVRPRRLGFAPRCYVHVGERVGQGQRCGFTPFGATVEILLPQSTRLNVSAGDRVVAGSAVIATLVHQSSDETKRKTDHGVENVHAAR